MSTTLNKAKQEFFLTRAQFNSRKDAGTLVVGAVYHITDDPKLPLIIATDKNKYLHTNATTGATEWVTLDKSSVGLGNVDNTSDANKPISTATQTALNGKQATLTAGSNITINNNVISAIDTTYTNATTSSDGLMSSSDKSKLDGIESGAEVNTIEGATILGNNLTITDKKIVIPVVTNNQRGVCATYADYGTTISGNGTITIVKATDQRITARNYNCNPIVPSNLNFAVKSALSDDNRINDMTDTEKANARGVIGAGTSNFSGSYNDLTNLPTISDATITVQKNGTTVKSFTLNQSTADTINITVPTQPSDIGAEVADATILKEADVVNNVTSTSTNAPLSANQGKVLNDRIDAISARGRFLSLWNSQTGLPLTNPSGTPYTYHAGDYFIVSNVSTTNYKPVGTTYTGVASTTVESGDVKVNYTYYYDGNGNWNLLSGQSGGGTIIDIQVNSTSVVSGSIANINTQTAYDSSTNKFATMSDVNSSNIMGSSSVGSATQGLYWTGSAWALTNTIPAAIIVDQNYNASSTNAQSGTAVASAISGKLDKDTTSGVYRVYANKNGTQGFYNVSSSVTADTIAYRGANGVLSVGTPTAATHATTKTYVDDIAATIPTVSSSGVTDGTNTYNASDKMEKTNPTGTGSFSLNRKSGTIIGQNSHAEGDQITASGDYSHAEGKQTIASGTGAHVEGFYTVGNHALQHVFGSCNIIDPSTASPNEAGTYIEIVGKGTSEDDRSNARTLDWSGNEILAGKLTVGAGPTDAMDVATKQYVDSRPTAPNITISSTAPSSPAAKDMWVDTGNNNTLKIYTGSAWITIVGAYN